MNRIEHMLRDLIAGELRSGRTPRQALDSVRQLLERLSEDPLSEIERSQVSLLLRQRAHTDGARGY